MSEKSKDTIIALVLFIGVLYGVCAFSQFSWDIAVWSTVSRAILGIGTIAILIWIIIVRNTQY